MSIFITSLIFFCYKTVSNLWVTQWWYLHNDGKMFWIQKRGCHLLSFNFFQEQTLTTASNLSHDSPVSHRHNNHPVLMYYLNYSMSKLPCMVKDYKLLPSFPLLQKFSSVLKVKMTAIYIFWWTLNTVLY